MDHALLLQLHVGAVTLSIALFLLRGALMIAGSPLLGGRVLRVLPHVVDTLLLLAAIGLVYLTQQYPFRDGWLTAKVIGLVVYIGLGTVALKRGRTRSIRIAAFVAALLVVSWIVLVARQRSVWPVPF
jgi:uncharacterized membrane protein SirB2